MLVQTVLDAGKTFQETLLFNSLPQNVASWSQATSAHHHLFGSDISDCHRCILGWLFNSQLPLSRRRLSWEDHCAVPCILLGCGARLNILGSPLCIFFTPTSTHSLQPTCSQIINCRRRIDNACVRVGLYFAAGVFLDLFLLGATTFAGVNYSTNAEAFQKAVRQVGNGCVAAACCLISFSGCILLFASTCINGYSDWGCECM